MRYDEIEAKIPKNTYELDDYEYLLIKTLQELTKAVNRLGVKNG